MFDLNDARNKAQLRAQIQRDIDAFSMTFDDGRRTHLGASLIGSNCSRYLWYVFRWMFRAEVEPRMYRLWQRGHREEVWLWAMLRACGWTIHETDPRTGKQIRVSAVEGHFGGSVDAIGFPPPGYPIQEWVLLECKTNKSGENGRKWDGFEKNGVVIEKPVHWAQACAYGFLSEATLGFPLRYVVYFAVNKDDDRLHIEPLMLDYRHGAAQIDKAQFVILSEHAPAKIHSNLSIGECKWCDARAVCHMGAAVERNCRSCAYAQPIQNKQWFCNAFRQVLTEAIIKTGCANWTQAL